jgi:hypothetical protein
LFEKRVLRRIFGPRRVEKNNDELHNLYFRMIKSKECVKPVIRTNGEKRNAYRILLGMSEEKRPLKRARRRWVDNNKIDLGDRMGWYCLD